MRGLSRTVEQLNWRGNISKGDQKGTWTTTFNLCFQQTGVNLIYRLVFLRILEGKEFTTAVTATSLHHFLLVQAATAAAVVEKLAEFHGSSIRLILSFSEMQLYSQLQIESNVCLSPHCSSASIMGLLSARLHWNAHEETNSFVFWSHWKFPELFKRLSEMLMQAEVNTIARSTHEGIVGIFNGNAPWWTVTF